MKIIISGGGTAGHVNPGIAIAKYYQKRHPDTQILFVGTEKGIEKSLATNEGFDYASVEVSGLKRSFSPKGIAQNVKISAQALKSVGIAKKIIKDFHPDVIIGCGGYVSFPVVYAGQKLGVKTIVLEVNIFAGVTTKVLSKKCDKILLAFSDTKQHLNRRVLDKVLVTGSPTKEDFKIIDKQIARKALKLSEKPLVVSFWGSTGALYMNKKMVDFTQHKDDSFIHIHATGKNAFEWFKNEANGENSEIVEYIYNMPRVMAAADLVICRGGAATISELSIMGKPAIIVPSPYVAENHQEQNARTIERAGGCKVMLEKEISGDDILNECKKLLKQPQKLAQMSKNIAKLANSNSNELIYNVLVELNSSR
ncbi:MAG: undecaprenyldiphospho-muramoylpentapeptide beta-N-acetylglucosaminyltransferase [Clostridia bacterium]